MLFVLVQPGDVDEIRRALSRRRRGRLRVPDVSDERRETIEIELRHTHLPAVAQAGFVDCDPQTDDVRHPHPPTILDTLLEACAGIERPDTVTE